MAEEPILEKRIARLCWNDRGWVRPSGTSGKSKNTDSHEGEYGWGHEEWLFDTGKLIDGYHYGFIEPVYKSWNSFIGRKYDVWLYAINDETRKRYWIGEIKELEVLDKTTAKTIESIYSHRGWFQEMGEQIKAHVSSGFSAWRNLVVFNVKFLPENLHLNDPPIEIPKNNPVYKRQRYVFYHFRNEFNISDISEEDDFVFAENNETGDDPSDAKSKIYVRALKAVEITQKHKEISEHLTKKLKEIYGEENVRCEHPLFHGTRIDIVVRDKDG